MTKTKNRKKILVYILLYTLYFKYVSTLFAVVSKPGIKVTAGVINWVSNQPGLDAGIYKASCSVYHRLLILSTCPEDERRWRP